MTNILGKYNTIHRSAYIGALRPPYPPAIEDGNTVGWYLSDDLTTITKDGSDFVSAWNDQLGSGHDLLQAVGADQPLWSANGILFDGVSEFMKTAAFTLNQPEMIYIVFKQIAWNLNNYIFDGNATNKGFLRQTNATPDLYVYAGTVSGISSALSLDTYGIARVLFNGASSKFIINEDVPITGNFGSLDMSGFTLSSIGAGDQLYSNIEVKEIIIRKVADGTQDEQDIYDYLAKKYGI